MKTTAKKRTPLTLRDASDLPCDRRISPVATFLEVVVFATLLAASTDLLFSAIYWGARGITLAQVLQAVASWVLGNKPAATAGTFTLALAVQIALYCPAVLALAFWARKHPAVISHWLITGAVWGVLAYLVTFRLVVPMMAYPIVPNASTAWIISCVLVHLCLIGPATAWLVLQLEERH
jgi:hypothetical protein